MLGSMQILLNHRVYIPTYLIPCTIHLIPYTIQVIPYINHPHQSLFKKNPLLFIIVVCSAVLLICQAAMQDCYLISTLYGQTLSAWILMCTHRHMYGMIQLYVTFSPNEAGYFFFQRPPKNYPKISFFLIFFAYSY